MGFRSGEFSGQSSSNTMVIKPAFGTFGSVGRCQVLLENEISISIKLVSRRKHEVLYNVLVDGCVDFRKHSGPTPADDMTAQIITDCGNFTLDFKQHGFCVSPLFLQTLGPWFPNEMQHLLSSEKRTLDHWATVQFFFSLAQVRCFCHLFLQCGDKWRWTGIAHWVRSGEHTGSHMCSQEKCKNWDLYRSRWGITHGPGCVRPGLSMLGPGGPVSCRV